MMPKASFWPKNSNLELKVKETHFFTGELDYIEGSFCNDGNFEIYDRYKQALKKAGFYVK